MKNVLKGQKVRRKVPVKYARKNICVINLDVKTCQAIYG